jgi:hypothetical protein
MTLQPSTIVQPLAAGDAASLGRDGYLKLHQAVPPSWLAELRTIFDDNILPSERWPVPRGYDWEHAQLDLDPLIQRVCHLPDLLSGAAQIIAGPFFLAQVEGRAPRQHNMTQMLHRDAEGDTALHAVAFVYLDDYAAANGATQLVPGSHRGGTLTTAPVVMAGAGMPVINTRARRSKIDHGRVNLTRSRALFCMRPWAASQS